MSTPTARLMAQHIRINDLCDNIERGLHVSGSTQSDASFRVLVTGSRTWTDTDAFATVLDALHAVAGPALVVVHGACPTGADAIAARWAAQHAVPVEAHPADWTTGRSAGPVRNAAMVATRPDLCVAFIAGDSPGATGCANLADAANIPTRRYWRGAVQVAADVRPPVPLPPGDPGMSGLAQVVLDCEIADSGPGDLPCLACDAYCSPEDLDERWHCPACAVEYVQWLATGDDRSDR